jgi:PBP1b-binding outer membrane lipoprotein LpoB
MKAFKSILSALIILVVVSSCGSQKMPQNQQKEVYKKELKQVNYKQRKHYGA